MIQETHPVPSLWKRSRLGSGAMAVLLWMSVLIGAGQAGEAAPAEVPVKDITSALGAKPFEFRPDLPGYSLGAVLVSVAQRVGANYSVTAAAEKLLKKRWAMDLKTVSGLTPDGPNLKIAWAEISRQLSAVGIDVHLSQLGSQRLMKVSSAREHLLFNNPEGHSEADVRAAVTESLLREAQTPADASLKVLAFEHAGIILVEGSPRQLRGIEKLAREERLKLAEKQEEKQIRLKLLSGDESGRYVLHYRLNHAWALTELNVKSLKLGDRTDSSSANGIAGALQELLKDYNAVPEFVQTRKLGDGNVPAVVLPESGLTARMMQSFTAAGVPGFEPLAAPSGDSKNLIPDQTRVRYKAVPLRTETDRESLAESLTPIGARTSVYLPQGGTILDVPTASTFATRTEEVQDDIETHYNAKLVPLEPVTPGGAATLESADTPQIGAFTVVADHANNALLVICPPAKRTDRLMHLLNFLEGAIGILDKPVSMVELSAAIIDIDHSRLVEWGPRFAVASTGKLGGWPTSTRSGFDLPRGTGTTRGLFSGLLDPATAGAEKITAETVAAEGLNIGALFVGSSFKLLATLRALEAEGDGHVLARPSVVTLDNTEALVSESSRFYLPSTGLNSGALTQIEIPLEVKVTPQVIELAKDKPAVSMRIRIMDGSLTDEGNVVDYGTVNTSAIVVPGESVLIAGRLRHEEQDEKRRVPLLGRIPGVGWAFKNSSVKDITQQRMIMITPTVVTRSSRFVSEAVVSDKGKPATGEAGQPATGSGASSLSTFSHTPAAAVGLDYVPLAD